MFEQEEGANLFAGGQIYENIFKMVIMLNLSDIYGLGSFKLFHTKRIIIALLTSLDLLWHCPVYSENFV